MGKTILVSVMTGAALLASATLAAAQQFGTADEAKAMLDRAATELKANEAAALAKFNDKDNKQFRDRDLYVFCFNTPDGKFTAHPNPSLMGTDVRALKVKDDPLGQTNFRRGEGSDRHDRELQFPEARHHGPRAEGILHYARC